MAIVVPVVTTFDAKGISKALANFKRLEGGAAKTGFALRAVDQGITSFGKSLAKVGAAVGLVGGIIGTKLVSAAYESQKVFKQTEQLILTTGGAAGHTAKSLSELATKISEQIGVDDELIQKSANLLLTFKQVQNQVGENNNVFDRAILAAQDLGNVFGSAEGAAMQLGKALADPERGITALRRSGVNFTEAQKQQISTMMAAGDILGAQKIILAEVEAQVGGTAKATATDFDRMKVAVGNLAEELGAELIPFVEKFARFIKDTVVPYVRELIALFQEEGLGGVVKKLSGDFVGFITNLDGFGAKVFYVVSAIAAFKLGMIAFGIATTVTTVIMQAFGASAAAASAAAAPIALIAFAIVAVGVALVAAYLKFEGFRKVVNFVINAIIGYFEFMINAWISAINLFIKAANLVNGVLGALGIKLPKVAEIGKVSFGRIGAAADGASRKMVNALNLIQQAEARNVGSKVVRPDFSPDPDPDPSGGETALQRAKRQLKEYTDGLKSVKEAQNGLKDSTRALADSQRNVLKATDDVRDAQDGLREATKKVMLAEEALERVRKGLGAGSDESKKAALKVEEAQRGIEESGYSLEDAQFAVIDATQKLAELRTSKEVVSARDMREAEIELARAKLALTEQQIAQTKSAEELALAQTEFNEITNGAKEGTDRYKEAFDELTKAKNEQDEASKKVLTALENEKEAIEKVAVAQNKLRDATYEVLDAEKALRELRKTTPKELRNEATEDFITRNTVFAAGVQLPDVGGISSAINSPNNSTATSVVINAPSLDPRAAREYVYDALIDYQRLNGPLNFQFAV